MKNVLMTLVLLASTQTFAANSVYADSVKKISAALENKNVVATLNDGIVNTVQLGGEDNMDVRIITDKCTLDVGLNYILKDGKITGEYSAQSISECY